MRRTIIITGLTLAAIVALLVACARTPGTTGNDGHASEEPAMGPIGDVPGDLLEAIVADAAERAGVEPADVEVISAESVTWNDGALGCPEPGMMYTQAIVPGYRVVVGAGREEMSFHASDRGAFRFCKNPKPPMEVNPNE